jgi:transcriptional regulator with PAS, ATPase and Fis domain
MNDHEKAKFLDAVVNNPYMGICIIDKSGITVLRGNINEKLAGINNSQILGKHYSNMPHYKELMDVLGDGVPKLGLPFKTVDGCHAIVHRIPLRTNDEIIGALSIISIKDIKELQDLFDKYDLLKSKVKYYDRELKRLRSAKCTFENIIGKSNKIVANRYLAQKYAQGHSSVLITGETGTGKDLFAQAIHLASPRRNGPFIRINCGTIPYELMESELFGYEGGAFTGATKSTKIGKFELADHGTIFLDEISSLPLSLQPKLLAVIQNREIERIGGNRVIKLDFRIISSTNINLQQMVANGTFRNDLYYRLSVLNLTLPPLRETYEDIQPLVQNFLAILNDEYGFNVQEIDPRVFDILSKWTWPGNIRELRNVMESAIQLCDKKCILASNLPDYILVHQKLKIEQSSDERNINIIKATKDEVERKLIESILRSVNWNKSKSAKRMGISRPHLYALLKKYNLQE